MRRLSTIDAAGGRQPFVGEDGAVHLVGNGEIYNHQTLRAEFVSAGHSFAWYGGGGAAPVRRGVGRRWPPRRSTRSSASSSDHERAACTDGNATGGAEAHRPGALRVGRTVVTPRVVWRGRSSGCS